jgi:RecG-like helicase
MKIKLNNLDTNFSIDTYQMFTGDSVYESEMEYYKDDHNKENIDINFDHKNIVKDLANESINTILSHLNQYEATKDIIKDIVLINSFSPTYYNYTTDSYDMQIDFNSKKLSKWIKENFLNDNVDELLNKWYLKDKENQFCAKLVIFLNTMIDKDSYNMSMWDEESNIYFNNMTTLETV